MSRRICTSSVSLLFSVLITPICNDLFQALRLLFKAWRVRMCDVLLIILEKLTCEPSLCGRSVYVQLAVSLSRRSHQHVYVEWPQPKMTDARFGSRYQI